MERQRGEEERKRVNGEGKVGEERNTPSSSIPAYARVFPASEHWCSLFVGSSVCQHSYSKSSGCIFMNFLKMVRSYRGCQQAVGVSGMGEGAYTAQPPPPTVKHAAQEAGSELCEILKFRSFLQSKSVNRVCKLLQLLGKFVPKSPTGASPLKPNGALLSQTPGQYSSPK